jgi:hypothetical protein
MPTGEAVELQAMMMDVKEMSLRDDPVGSNL